MRLTVPARKSIAIELDQGQSVRVINTYGSQVVDTWAFSRADPKEFMSMEHSRSHMGRISPAVGSSLMTNRRRPALTMTEDTSGGVHDTLLSACDRYRYELLGYEGLHDNCTDNLHKALGEKGLSIAVTPSPLNLFENVPPQADGSIAIEPPVSTPGSYVTLRAEMDLVVVFSACPQDMAPTNGPDMTPTDAEVEIL